MRAPSNALITIPTVNDDGSVSMFGDSDERYKIAGGNASLPEAIASRLNSQNSVAPQPQLRKLWNPDLSSGFMPPPSWRARR